MPTATSSPARERLCPDHRRCSAPTASPQTDDDVVMEGNPAPTAASASDPAQRAAHRPHVPGRHRPHRANPFSSQQPARRSRPTPTTSHRRSTTTSRSTYDDELLDEHFMAGDGRVNENIGLTAVHHVFHAEHNRLVEHTKEVVLGDAATSASEPVAACRRRCRRFPTTPAEIAALRVERRAPVPGGQVRHRDAVPAPGVRGVRAQGPAERRPLPRPERLRRHHRSGDRGRVRAHGLPLRPLDAAPRPSTGSIPNFESSEIGLIKAFLNPLAFDQSGTLTAEAGRRRHRARHDPPGRQRDRRVRDRGAAQQPARPAARPAPRSTSRAAATPGFRRSTRRAREFYEMTQDSQLKPYDELGRLHCST